MTLAYVFGFIGAALMLASYLMKSMLPLRLVALAACLFLMLYGFAAQAMPTLMLYGLLIPINARKAWHVHQLVKAIEHAKGDTPVSEWLLPHMHEKKIKVGTQLWAKGDVATEMVYVEHGTLRLVEIDEVRGAGTLLGEIGVLAPDNKRTLTIRCETDCTLFTLTAQEMATLYYQNPKLGFHVMRLVVQRLSHDVDRARAAAAQA